MKKFLSFIVLLFLLSGIMVNGNLPRRKLLNKSEQTFSTKSQLYPNPARDFTIVKNTSNTRIKNISILSVVGTSVISKEVTDNGSQELNVAKLSAGKYFVKVFYIDGSQEILSLIKL